MHSTDIALDEALKHHDNQHRLVTPPVATDRINSIAAEAMKKFKSAKTARSRFVGEIKRRRLTDTALEILFSRLVYEATANNGGVQSIIESQTVYGAADQSAQAAGAVQPSIDSHLVHGGTQPSSAESSNGLLNSQSGGGFADGDAVHHGHDSQPASGRVAPNTDDLPEVPEGFYRTKKGSIIPLPNNPHINGKTADLRFEFSNSIFKRYKLPNGMEIGEVVLGNIPSMLHDIREHIARQEEDIIQQKIAERVLQSIQAQTPTFHHGFKVMDTMSEEQLATIVNLTRKDFNRAEAA